MTTMPEIQSHQFGRMTISGRSFTSDLIILPTGKILDQWFRQSGHYLIYDDLKTLIQTRPDIIVIGTGVSGRMKIDPDLLSVLKERNIDVICHETKEAVNVYNNKIQTDTNLGAGFHLTC